MLIGDATVVKDNRTVRSDTMTARFTDDDKGKMTLSRADIVGNVVITDADRSGPRRNVASTTPIRASRP